jgi:hypothetical protein
MRKSSMTHSAKIPPFVLILTLLGGCSGAEPSLDTQAIEQPLYPSPICPNCSIKGSGSLGADDANETAELAEPVQVPVIVKRVPTTASPDHDELGLKSCASSERCDEDAGGP